MNRFPKRKLRKLRKHAIEAAEVVATCENSWGVRNIEKQHATIDGLRRTVQSAEKSIGLDRVKFILNHNVPQIRSLLDLTSPRPGERGDLLPKQNVEAILSNIDSEIDRIATSRWRLLGIPGVVVAVVGVIGILTQFLGPKRQSNTDTSSPSPTYTPSAVTTTPTPTPNPTQTPTPSPTPTPTTSRQTPSSPKPTTPNLFSTPAPSKSTAPSIQSQGFYHVRIRNVTMSTISYLVDRGHGWERNSLEPGFVRVHWWTSPRLAVIRPDTSQGVDKSEWNLKPMFFDHVIESNGRQSNELPLYDFRYNENRQLTLR